MTIYDIAKEAGVSGSTVSRVVNGKLGVNVETRKKVQQLLDKYKFFPNETARGLVNQSPRMIGILLSDIRNTHYTDGAYIIEQEFAQKGYCSIIFNTGAEERAKAEYIRILASRRVDGAILEGSTYQSPSVREAIVTYLPNTPIVIANGYLDLPNVSGVLADEFDGVGSCVELLRQKQKHNLVYVTGNETPSNLIKLQGFSHTVGKLFGTEPISYQEEPTFQGGYDATVRIMKEHPKTDGIIYAVDLMAVGGTRALFDLKIAIPQTVSIIGIDNSPYALLCNPKLTSLDTKLAELSIACSRTLADALEKRNGLKKIMVYSSIVERETT